MVFFFLEMHTRLRCPDHCYINYMIKEKKETQFPNRPQRTKKLQVRQKQSWHISCFLTLSVTEHLPASDTVLCAVHTPAC